MKSILIVRLGAMGDIVHALPGAASLKHSFPQARITWVVEPKWAPLLEGNGFVDRLILFRRDDPVSWKRTKDDLRAERYDLAVDFQGLFKSALIAHVARPERIAGFGAGVVRERPAGLFYSTRVPSKAVHVVDQALDLAAGAGALHLVRAFPLPQGTREGRLPDGPFALASPLAGWASKQWPLEHYEALACMLRRKLDLPLVLNGAPGTVPALAGTLAHESGIAGLIDATRRAALVIGVDSGPLHLAAALNKSGAAIFGPTDPIRNGPYGADPNRRNDADATALMWAVTDLEKTRLLVDHGADVNAHSAELRTPLLIAAGRPGNAAVVKLLLERGAQTDPNQKPASQSSALIEAATAGDPATMRLLIAHGASVKSAGQPALSMAITNRCTECLDLLMAGKPDKASVTGALGEIANLPDIDSVRRLIDAGADVNAPDPAGRTPLMYAAGSDLVALDVVRLLVQRGADVNAKVGHAKAVDTGISVLDIARLRGNTPVVEFLVKAGAKGSGAAPPVARLRARETARTAVQASLPLLQRADASFVPKAGCISCHNDSLTAMTVGLARKSGFRVDEATAAKQVQANVLGLEKMRDRLRQGFFVPVEDTFGPSIAAYMLIGLDAEHYKSDLNTDAAAMYLKMHQRPDGEWAYAAADSRPPLCSDYIAQTALSMRALQLYTPAGLEAEYRRSVELAGAWLAKAQPKVNDDRAWRLMGLAWWGQNPEATRSAMNDLLAAQRPDGGWGDIGSLPSGAYATGQSLAALLTAGKPASDPACRKAIEFLLHTQQEDGSWYVKTRALAFQPFFDSDFPHGFDQFISAAGSNWATIALTMASPARN